MTHCCDVFKRLLEGAGKRGFSVVARKASGYRFFCLEARACDFEDKFKMKNIPYDCEVPRPLTVAMQIGIQYCPACGSRLDTIIAEHESEFEEFAEKCKKFLHEE
jgi:hypothetical protein